MHGGKTPRGVDSPQYKHGRLCRYSADLAAAPEVKEAYEAHRDDPGLLDTTNEIALLRALLGRYLRDHPTALTEDETAEQIRAYASEISKSVERKHKQEYGVAVTVKRSDFGTFVAKVLDAVEAVLGHGEHYQQIEARLDQLIKESPGADYG